MWTTDLTPDHPAYVPGSLLIAYGGLDPARRSLLEVAPDAALDSASERALRSAATALASAVGVTAEIDGPSPGCTWGARAIALVAPLLEALDADSLAVTRIL